MKISDLENALRAAKEITGQNDFVVIGSCSILGSFPNAPDEMTKYTKDIDIWVKNYPEMGEMLRAAGRNSDFEGTNGFFIEGVGPDTATVPEGWEKRLVKVCNENTNFATGWCLDPHDAAVAKLIAGRDKDRDFVEVLFREKYADPEKIRQLLKTVKVADTQKINLANDFLDQALEDATAAQRRAAAKNAKKLPPIPNHRDNLSSKPISRDLGR